MTAKHERGFAMPAVIGALVIIGILVTAGFYVARQEIRIGVAGNFANKAVDIAQAGANEVMANWNGYELSNIPVWQDTTISGTVPGGAWRVTITNRNSFIYNMVAVGRVTEGGALWAGATRRIGIVTKVLFADINPPAALTTRDTLELTGGAAVIGDNYDPAAWSGFCTGFPTDDKPGVMSNDSTAVSTTGTSYIDGSPAVQEDSTIVDSTFTNFGDLDWAQLTALADLEGKDISALGSVVSTIQPDSLGPGVCNEATLNNWGDTIPTAACGAYFPLMYHDASLRIQSGGYGQGILLIEGDLELRGNFTFMGIIILQGSLDTQGSGNRIIGAVMASNAYVDQTLAGTSIIQSSQCAVKRAILNNASLSRARQLAPRGWVDLSAATN